MMIRITVTKIFQVTQILLMEFFLSDAAVRCQSPTDLNWCVPRKVQDIFFGFDVQNDKFCKVRRNNRKFACGLHPYFLNREPNQFRYTGFMVDDSHWQGQRKLKKPDYSGKGGHLSCSSSYNFNAYKQRIETDTGALNSQGREQIHSILDKCSSSLRQTNYFNFMRYMRVFFAIRNSMIMNKL